MKGDENPAARTEAPVGAEQTNTHGKQKKQNDESIPCRRSTSPAT